MSDTRQALEDKLEYAGTINELVLSDSEILQAKSLLLETEQCIVHIGSTVEKLSDNRTQLKLMVLVMGCSVSLIRVVDASIEVLAIVRTLCQERFRKCNIALAPHKRLPAEILLKIFIYSLPIESRGVLVHNEVPWVLGKVCSRWRSISRSEPHLWKKYTIDIQHSPRQLLAACDCLPSFAYLAVISPPSKNFDTDFDTVLTPYLWRVQELTLEVNPDLLDRFWTSIAGSDCFSAVEVFMVDLEIRGWVGTPISEEMIASWTQLAPLKHARSLHSFRLIGGNNLPLFSLHMPWSQLHTATLARDLTPNEVVQLLQLCSSAETLQLDFSNHIDDDNLPSIITPTIPEHPQAPLNNVSRSLRDLTLSGSIPHQFALDIIPFHGLTYLHITELNIDGDTQYQLLKQCTSLTHLRTRAARTSAANVCSGDLPLPLLCSLHVTDIKDNWLFVALVTPSLVNLMVSSWSGIPLNVLAILDMITSPGYSRLSSLELRAGDPEGQPHLAKLLAAIPTAVDITIRGMTMDADCLQLISVGEILPLLEKLTGEASTDEEFLRMMEDRAHHVTHTPNMSQICSAYFIVRQRVLPKEVWSTKLAQLEDSYGMSCFMTVARSA